MAREGFLIEKFLEIVSENGFSGVQVLFGLGAPGGDTGEQDAAPIGSLYLDTSTGHSYKKDANAGAAADWFRDGKLSSTYTAAGGDPTAEDSFETAIGKVDDNLDDLTQALGTAQGDQNMGAYTGSLLTDNTSAKANIQELADYLTGVVDFYTNLINDQFIPYGELVVTGFKGIKGQWSYNDNRYYKCIATDTWFVTSNENLVDEKISDLLKQFVNQYVPCCLVPNNSATGIKGQWSFQVGHSSHKGYVKICIATNTWVRFEVDTLF